MRNYFPTISVHFHSIIHTSYFQWCFIYFCTFVLVNYLKVTILCSQLRGSINYSFGRLIGIEVGELEFVNLMDSSWPPP